MANARESRNWREASARTLVSVLILNMKRRRLGKAHDLSRTTLLLVLDSLIKTEVTSTLGVRSVFSPIFPFTYYNYFPNY